MDLKEYEQEKFAIADILRSIAAIDTKDQTLESECRDLLTRLADDRFNLLVVGRFNRGKSTLMNALLGADYLPTGIVPLTSVITTVRYGSRKHVVLNFSDRGMSREVELAQLAEYVTQQSNPGNIKNLSYAEIELPVEILRRGFFFVDSPGLGSSISENTATTERFLPQADAFLLVTSFESPLSEEEDRILRRIRQTNKRLFVVINKEDTANTEERKQVLKFVEECLQRFSFSKNPSIFSISARRGLEAKLRQDKNALEESGIHSLEKELLRFLTEERAQSFLSNMHGRTSSLLWRRSQSGGDAKNEEAYKTLTARLNALRQKSLNTDALFATSAGSEVVVPTVSVMPLHLDKTTGCSICGSILDAIFEFLRKYQYDLTIDPSTQQEHSRRGGFCPLHTWQYENIASPYGVCTAYPELAHRVAKELNEVADRTSLGSNSFEDIRYLLPTSKTCPVCEIRIDVEGKAVDTIAKTVRDAIDSGGSRFPACCLPHLVAVTSSLGQGSATESLLRAHAWLLERTAEDLQRYALRHNAIRRNLASEEERRASLLILLMLAGHRSVSAPWDVKSIGSG